MAALGSGRKTECHPAEPHFARGFCLSCYKKDWNERHPRKRAASIRRYGLKRYGLTEGTYRSLLKSQNHVCPICLRSVRGLNRKKLSISVDHDHKTGRVRGILHDKCNNLLGFVHDDIQTLYRAIEYLREKSEVA